MGERANRRVILALSNLRQSFGTKVVFDGLNLEVREGDACAIIGGSGSGKTVLLQTLLGLMRPAAGTVSAFGYDPFEMSDEERGSLQRHWGILFQQDALFSSMTVRENITLLMREHFDLPDRLLREFADLKIALAGLDVGAGMKYPAELSGGMAKRAGLARALAVDPELLILDEPTAGLDPIAAGNVRALLRRLHRALRPTMLLVTHDMDLVQALCDRVAVLGEGRFLAHGSLNEVAASEHPTVQAFFRTPSYAASNTQRQGNHGRSAKD